MNGGRKREGKREGKEEFIVIAIPKSMHRFASSFLHSSSFH
jgi:hypothetical protein